MLRRLTAVFCVCVLMCCTLLPAGAAPISNDWFWSELDAITEAQLLPDLFADADLTQYISREEVCTAMATLLARGGLDPQLHSNPGAFLDCANPDVLFCYDLGLVSGYGDGTFLPNNRLTRQEMFCLLFNLMRYFGCLNDGDPTAYYAFDDCSEVEIWAVDAANALISARVLQGDGGLLLPTSALTREQALALLYRAWQRIEPTLWYSDDEDFFFAEDAPLPDPNDWSTTDPEEDDEDPVGQAPENEAFADFINESYAHKYERIFGSTDAPKYASSAEAKAHMVEVTVPVWNFNTSHVLVSTSRTFTIHEAIADVIVQIFTEIYESGEQFPIYSIGGYAWRGDGTSEHNWGIAIDINPNENYQIRNNGTILCGSHWTPGEDPYSIPEDGIVVRTFAKYGFAWGGNAWQSSHDYMHFSYFGN